MGEWLSLFAESRINEKLILSLFEERSPQPPLKRGAIERYFPTFSRWFGLSKSVSVSIDQPDLPIPTRTDLRHLVNLSLLTDISNNNGSSVFVMQWMGVIRDGTLIYWSLD